jgi:hypothetical protein
MTETCSNCGYVNATSDPSCKQCRKPLGDKTRTEGAKPQGIVLEDGYVLPPPPNISSSGVWRDKSILIMTKDALLPNRCVKCNEPTDGSYLKRKLTWHHPAFYLLLFVAFVIYLIVALVVRQTATVGVGLCDRHREKRKRNILITWSLVSLGVGAFVLALLANDGLYALLGGLLLLGGTVYGIITIRIVGPSKIDHTSVWLTGVNKDYLNELPQWPRG